MIKIAICEDNPVQLKASEKAVREKASAFSAETDAFTSGSSLLDAIRKSDYSPDIAILDIDMPGKNGIETAKELNSLCPDCSVIFLTAYLSYATDVYETRHCYFVLKSQLSERLLPALARAAAAKGSTEKLEIRDAGRIFAVSPADVLYFERNLRKTLIMDTSGRLYTTYQKPEELISGIRKSSIIKVHQSYYVNMEHVKSMSASAFTLSSGQIIPISRSRYKEVKEAFHRYICSEI